MVDGLGGGGAGGLPRARSSCGSRAPSRSRRRARASCASRSSARRSSSGSTRALPPSGPILQRARALRPVPVDPRPGGERAAAEREDRARPARCGRPGAAWCRCSGTACGLGVEGSGWVARDGIVVTNAHVVAGQDDTTVQLGGDGPPLRRRARSGSTRRTTSRSCACPGSAGAPPLALARRREAGHVGRGPRLPGERPVRRAAGAARPDARRCSPRTPTGAGRCSARSRRCAAWCAPATRAARWSTASGRVVATVFAAATSRGRTGYARAGLGRAQRARRARAARSTPAPARARALADRRASRSAERAAISSSAWPRSLARLPSVASSR